MKLTESALRQIVREEITAYGRQAIHGGYDDTAVVPSARGSSPPPPPARAPVPPPDENLRSYTNLGHAHRQLGWPPEWSPSDVGREITPAQWEAYKRAYDGG